MKVCILSMQRVCNYGSVLQSYSLKKIISDMGNDVHFIDIDSRNRDLIIDGNEGLVFDQDVDGFANNKLLTVLKKINYRLPMRIRNKFLQKQQDCLFVKFQTDELHLNNEDNDKKYDICVIGSDEVFNCVQAADMARTTQLFGNVKQAKHVITYAASCGFCTHEALSDEMKVRIRKAFSNISNFSVRDANTKQFVRLLTGRDDIIESFDPVFIGDFEQEIQKVQENVRLPEKFCLIYAYPNRIHSSSEINSIKKFCKAHDLKIITIGMQQSWVSDHRIMSPFELLYAFKKASYVVTDTFHGAIFSAKYSQKYSIIIRDSNSNKLGDLVDRIGIRNHVLSAIEEIESTWSLQETKDEIRKLEKEGRDATIRYLDQAMHNKRVIK